MPNQSPTESDGQPSILLAEDSEDDAFFFQRALKKTCRPCHFHRAANGKLAIQMLEKMLALEQGKTGAPDLIFLDLKMPVMSGFEVLEWIQTTHKDSLRVIVLSGSNDQADRARAASLGATEYLVKPITPEDLEGQLKSIRGSAAAKNAEEGI